MRIAGIDEAGRGSLAGPVVAAAVILPSHFNLPGLKDSKLLSPQKRSRLASQIIQEALALSLGVIWQQRIDKINILQATFEAMSMAVSRLKVRPDQLLIDGNKTIPVHLVPDIIKQTAIIDGDKTEPCISAASILAKTHRDRLMICLDKTWPEYGFGKHKGYGTQEHIKALNEFGPCPLHRMTFKRVLKN